MLSHAAQRKEKKRQKRLDKPSTSTDAGANGGSKSEPNTQGRRQNSIWVGNMSFKTTSDGLKAFFKDAGEVTRIHMPTKTGATRGTGMRGENMGCSAIHAKLVDALD